MVKWFKYTWVCLGECNALIEYTMKSGHSPIEYIKESDYTPDDLNIKCLCGSTTTLISVEDSTVE